MSTAGVLPPLREDLRLFPGPSSASGAPSFTLYDPALHRYLRIGRLEAEILHRWRLGDPARIAESVRQGTPLVAAPEDVIDLLHFAERARLLRPHGEAADVRLSAEAAAGRMSPAFWLLKNYLFIRIPLFDPDRLLAGLGRWLRFMFTRGFAYALLLAAVLGLYLISRQWDAFTHAFMHLFSLEGAALVAVAMAFAKAVHEFGHGLAAKHFGCKVPAMGVALLVMWPMLWTDCTDAWRLTDRRQRLAIDAAGMAAEMVLAVIASLLWCVLSDGSARTAAFLLASSSWLVTVAVNINPLMRFDGYFLMSDALDVPNLQDRSFALGRWRLREWLFGFGDPPPERLPLPRATLLIGYAVACWVYRFGLFLGIAVLVYHLTFKLMGIGLMTVEVGWFIVRPIVMELNVWRRRWRFTPTTPRRLVVVPLLVVCFVGALILPWSDGVHAPALERAIRQTPVLTLEPGRLRQILPNGTAVAAGQVVLTLDAPDIAHDQQAALAEITGLRARLAGQGFDKEAQQDLPQAWHSLEAAYARLRGAEARATQLEFRAPFSGRLVDMSREAVASIWLPRRERLGFLVDDTAVLVEAFVGEIDIERVHLDAKARFSPEDGGDAIDLRVTAIAPGAERFLDAPILASVHGGPVAAQRLADGRLETRDAVYRVRLEPVSSHLGTPQIRRGSIRIAADATSPVAEAWRRAVAILMREAGL